MSETDVDDLFWAGPPPGVRSRHYHIYDSSNGERSLCGQYAHASVNMTAPVEPDDEWRDGHDCKECSRKAGVLDE